MDLASGAELIVTGRQSDSIGGGSAGRNAFWDDYYGWDGIGVSNDGATRYSGADVRGVCCGYEEQPPYPDPFLLATLQTGTLRVELHGVPNGNARLLVGTQPQIPFAGFLVKPAMIEAPRVLWLGVIDASGVIVKDIPWTFPALYPERALFLLQGSVFEGGASVRTNSAFLLSR